MIGGGPAGVASAFRMHSAGLNVCLVSRPGRWSGRCGRAETVQASALADLSRMGLRLSELQNGLRPLQTVVSEWNGARSLLSDPASRYIVDRQAFDMALCEGAQALGLEIFRCSARDVAVTKEGVAISLDGGRIVQSRYAVDASGRGARWSRRLGASAVAFDQLTALSAIYPSSSSETRLMIEATGTGWLIALTDAQGMDQVSFFTDRARIGAAPVGDQLNAHCAASDLFLEFGERKANEVRLWPGGVRTLRHAVLGRLLAVGDAAQTIDPLSGSGVRAAIEGGIAAADAVVLAVRNGPDALSRYERFRCAEFMKHIRLREAYYTAIPMFRRED